MSPVVRPSSDPQEEAERSSRHEQRRFWDALYTENPGVVGAGPSPLARWALRFLPEDGRGRRLLELGAGVGRDLPSFLGRGYTVAAVDVSRVAVQHARRRVAELPRSEGVPRPVIDVADAVEFLATQPDGSAQVVYSNLFFTMGFPEAVDRKIRAEVARVAAPGAFHLYSVRDRSDAWFGKGKQVAEDVWDPGPEGPPLRFFEEATVRRRADPEFAILAVRNGGEGQGDYRRRVLYVAEQRRPDR